MAAKVNSEVARIHPRGNGAGVFIRLKKPSHKPKDGCFELKNSHPNFNALYSLTLVAAANRQKLQIRTRENIVPTSRAEILDMYLDW